MIGFRTQLQQRCLAIATTALGTDIKTYDNHLHDVELAELPFLVVNVRTAEKAGASEIGTNYDLYMWTVHFYYMDIEEDWNTGDSKRDTIISKLEKALEENRRLGNLDVVATDGHREYVYDSSISAMLFDNSGQEEYYSVVSELYLNVYTAKS